MRIQTRAYGARKTSPIDAARLDPGVQPGAACATRTRAFYNSRRRTMLSNRLSVAAATIAASLGCSPEKTSPSLATSTAEMRSMLAPTVTSQESGAAFRFYAVSPVNAKVVWASAGGGTYALTTDGGKTWKSRQVPG